MKIVLQINGGIGKSIMATAVVAAIKNQHPDSKVIVITSYPEVFEGNRKVYKNPQDQASRLVLWIASVPLATRANNAGYARPCRVLIGTSKLGSGNK